MKPCMMTSRPSSNLNQTWQHVKWLGGDLTIAHITIAPGYLFPPTHNKKKHSHVLNSLSTWCHAILFKMEASEIHRGASIVYMHNNGLSGVHFKEVPLIHFPLFSPHK